MQNLRYEHHGSLALITINRPDKLNALNRQTLLEIEEAVATAMADAAVHAVILTGSGDKAFAAGADVAEFAHYTATEARDLSAVGHRIMDSIATAPKPVLAAINGFALGGGLELAMACHLRTAAPTARMGQPEVNLGLIPGYGGTQRLVEWVGRARALEMLMSGDPIDAATALQWGLVNRIAPPPNLCSRTQPPCSTASCNAVPLLFPIASALPPWRPRGTRMAIFKRSKPSAAFSSSLKAAKALGPSSKSARPPSVVARPVLDHRGFPTSEN